jgi:hypothetical protein
MISREKERDSPLKVLSQPNFHEMCHGDMAEASDEPMGGLPDYASDDNASRDVPEYMSEEELASSQLQAEMEAQPQSPLLSRERDLPLPDSPLTVLAIRPEKRKHADDSAPFEPCGPSHDHEPAQKLRKTTPQPPEETPRSLMAKLRGLVGQCEALEWSSEDRMEVGELAFQLQAAVRGYAARG